METMVHTDQITIRRIQSPGAGTLFMKRAFDIVCAALGLLVLSPVLLVTAILVGTTSPGGVLFRPGRSALHHL